MKALLSLMRPYLTLKYFYLVATISIGSAAMGPGKFCGMLLLLAGFVGCILCALFWFIDESPRLDSPVKNTIVSVSAVVSGFLILIFL